MRRVLVVGMVGAAALLGGCREEAKRPALPDAAAPYVEALSKRLEGRQYPPILTPDQERCVATAVIGGIGHDALVKAGITPESVEDKALRDLAAKIGSPARAEAIANGIVDCNVGGKFAGLFATAELKDGESGAPDSATMQKVIDCIGTDVDSGQARQIIAGYFFRNPPDEVRNEVRELLIDCGFETR